MSSSFSLNDDNLDFDEKIDQTSYIGQQQIKQKNLKDIDGFEDANNSDFDDGGFMSDEVDENKGFTS